MDVSHRISTLLPYASTEGYETLQQQWCLSLSTASVFPYREGTQNLAWCMKFVCLIVSLPEHSICFFPTKKGYTKSGMLYEIRKSNFAEMAQHEQWGTHRYSHEILPHILMHLMKVMKHSSSNDVSPWAQHPISGTERAPLNLALCMQFESQP